MTVDILGTNYMILKKKYTEDEAFEKNSWDGYCNEILKQIVICDMKTYPNFENATKEEVLATERSTLRHEIVHAFFNESGLSCCSLNYSGGWAKNEEMIDWFAIQGEKIYKAWQEAETIFFAHTITLDNGIGEKMAKAVMDNLEKDTKRTMAKCLT